MIQNIVKYAAGMLAAFAFIVTFSQTTYAQQQLDVPQSSSASLNWSGYVADANTGGTGYTSVTGTWVVPSVSATTSGTADATWVGIGGVESRDLIQAGTQAIVDSGAVTYSAWIETLPGFSKSVPLAVQSGDSVTATLTEESPGSWLVDIRNNTSGSEYTKTVSYNSSHSSAEWIEEMVSNGDGTFRPLDSFGSVGFTNAAATVNGANENLAQLGAQPLKMVSVGKTLASTSVIGSDNESFTVTRTTAPVATEQQQYSDYLSQVPVTITIVRHHHGYGFGNGSYSVVGIPLNFTIIGL